MHRLLILSRRAQEYRALVEAARLPVLAIVALTTANLVGADPRARPELVDERRRVGPEIDIVFGEPSLIRDALPQLPALRWVQSSWAGVEPLLDPSLRRDYVLTN